MFLVLNGICEIYIRSNREFLSEHKISRIQINGALIARQFTEDEKEYIEQVNKEIQENVINVIKDLAQEKKNQRLYKKSQIE